MKTLKYAWRFLMRSKSYTIINLLGLAFSLACSIILMRYIHRELTVDTHCIDREHVYAICTNTEGNRGLSGLKQYNYDTISIDNRFVEAMTTYIPLEKDYVISGTNRIPARNLVTDSVFFQLFHYPIVQGKLSLTTPQSALLTEKYACKIFGNENPIGKVLRYSNGKDITVEGIVGEPECKTTINFDIILSSKLSQHWERMNTELYRFLPGTDINAINKTGSVPRYINDPKYDTRTHTFSLISVKDIYWDGSLTDREPAMFLSGNHSHLIILSGVCLLLLLTGILNFINLYLVALLRRGKEYGLKKVFGVCGKTLFANIWIVIPKQSVRNARCPHITFQMLPVIHNFRTGNHSFSRFHRTVHNSCILTSRIRRIYIFPIYARRYKHLVAGHCNFCRLGNRLKWIFLLPISASHSISIYINLHFSLTSHFFTFHKLLL